MHGTINSGSANALGTRKGSQLAAAEVIPEENDQESNVTEKKDMNELDDSDDDDEELGRSEEHINLEQISVHSSAKSTQSAK